MLLQCEIQDGDASGGAGATSGLCANTLESLFELNENCLGLFAEQARAGCGEALLSQFDAQWRLLDAAGRRRAASCHYLLFDAGLGDPRRWQRPAGEARAASAAAFFTVPGTAALLQAVCVFGWHLARCQPSAAQLLLGMPAPCVNLLAQRTLGQVRGLTAAHPEWLRPRWLRHPRAWRELLAAALPDDPPVLWRAQLRGQTLLAAETRLCIEPLRLGPALGVRRGPVVALEQPRPAAPARLQSHKAP
ncbi:MAG TPA: hypothetical protein VGI91_04165 [Steroidobacteraceae bacterium]|jgi:hypothetical protein